MKKYFTSKEIRELEEEIESWILVLIIMIGVCAFIILMVYIPAYILVKLLGL